MDNRELDKLRAELAGSPEHWQFDLLKPRDLASFARDRDVKIWNGETVVNLWRAGLLRADIVRSKEPLDVAGLKLVSAEEGVFAYCDVRPVPHRPEGYGGIFQAPTDPLNIELSFHPFRLLVLHHVDRVFQSRGVSTQYLLNPAGLVSIVNFGRDHLDQWTSTEQCAERFEFWNRIAEFATVMEPSTHGKIFHSIRWRYPDTEQSLRAKLASQRERIRAFFLGVTAKEIGTIRGELCTSAEIFDDNKLTHVLLRLTLARERKKLKSALGASMLLLGMSEVIRRAAEDAHGVEYPEEDELGFGQWMSGARKSIYGAERIVDAPPEVQRDFLTAMGLHAGVKIRVYVEGETELGAIMSAAGPSGGVEYVNLRGNVIEKKGRGLAFAESLKSDMNSRVFSVVMLDGDNEDNVRALKKAAQDGAFFGRFFIAAPDFEFDNFSVEELLKVALDHMAQIADGTHPSGDFTAVLRAASGKSFFAALERAGLDAVRKSTAWGTAIMAYAVRHPELPEGHPRAGQVRPAVAAARLIIDARSASYTFWFDRYEVDPEAGELRKRPGAPEE